MCVVERLIARSFLLPLRDIAEGWPSLAVGYRIRVWGVGLVRGFRNTQPPELRLRAVLGLVRSVSLLTLSGPVGRNQGALRYERAVTGTNAPGKISQRLCSQLTMETTFAWAILEQRLKRQKPKRIFSWLSDDALSGQPVRLILYRPLVEERCVGFWAMTRKGSSAWPS
jgi:hypothetical protein